MVLICVSLTISNIEYLILSAAYVSSWRNVCSDHLATFAMNYRSSYSIIWMTLYQMHSLQIFLPLPKVPFDTVVSFDDFVFYLEKK